MATRVLAILLLQELASNVICFRQNTKHGNSALSDLIASSGGGHERAFASSDVAHALSSKGNDAEEDEDACPSDKMPKNSKGFLEYYQEMVEEKKQGKTHDDAENTKLFFACLHDAEDYSKFFNVRHMMTLEENISTKTEPKKHKQNQWVAYSYGSGKRYFIATVMEGKKLKRSVVTYENGNYTGLPEVTRETCPKWSKNGDACELYEVSELDLVCVNTKSEDFNESESAKCSEHVVNTMVFFGNAEVHFGVAFKKNGDEDVERLKTAEGPLGKYFINVDGEQTTAYCGFGKSVEDFADGYAKQVKVSAMDDVEEGAATNAQCLMWSCVEHEGKVPYDYWYKCRFDSEVWISFPIVLVWLLFWFLLMGVIADGYLVPALVKIGRGLKMSDALLGATLLALGGAANDFMVGIASAVKNVKKANKAHNAGEDEPDLEDLLMWLGGVFGTGFFINTLVAALVMIFAPAEGISVIPGVITRDICFRMLAVSTMIAFGWFGTIKWWTASFMILMYLVYVFLTLQDASKRKATNASEASEANADAGGSCARLSRGSVASFSAHGKLDAVAPEPAADAAAASFVGEEDVGDRIKRHMGYDPDGGFLEQAGFIAALPIRWAFALTMATQTWDPIVNALMPLCISIFIPYASFDLLVSVTNNEEKMNEIFRTEQACFALVGLILSGGIFLYQKMLAGEKGLMLTTYILPMTYSWVTFVTCVLWLALVANEVLDCLSVIAEMFKVPTMIAGMTMLAWGNCVDNVFATIGLAKAGEFGVAITGIYAAPMFNVLFGTGITLLMITGMKWDYQCDFPMSNSAVIMLCTLLVILACTLLFTMLNGWKMTRTLGAALAFLYPTVLIVAFAVGDNFPNYSPLDI